MGPKTFQIEILKNGIVSYFPGQTIEGILHVVTTKECKTEGITVIFDGKATVHWTEMQRVSKERRKSKKRTTRTKTVHYSAEEKYFDCQIYLLGTDSMKVYLPPGQHQYPFQFTLPQGLPSSYVGSHGMVWYEVRAEMKRAGKKNFVSKIPFTVNGIVDLNTEPGAAQPMETRKFKNLCCLFCKSGPIGFILRLPRKGYVSGEFLRFTAELSNLSSRKVNGVTMYLVQVINYHATQKTRSSEKVICKAKGPIVAPGETEIWTGNVLQIPPLPPTRLANCRIIDIQYILKIEMDVAGPSVNLRHEIPVIIGSIPLRNTFNEIQSLQTQIPVPQSSGSRDSNSHEDLPAPSAPSKSEMLSSQTSYFQENYPDMPPPTYAETIQQDQFNRQANGSENPTFSDDDTTPSAPPPPEVYDFSPKYITYAWQT